MLYRNSQVRKFFTLLLLVGVLTSALPLHGQTRRGGGAKPGASTTAASQTKQAAAKCNGAWTGSITYTRQQSMTDNKTEKRVSGRGEDTRSWEMKYDYRASVAVTEAPERNGSSVGKANITHNFSSNETTQAKEKNSCDRGKTWQEMSGTFTSETKTRGQTQRQEANVHVGVNADGSYTVSVALPQIQGVTTGKQTSSFSGQCVAKEGKTLTMPETVTQIDGNSLTSDGSHRVSPADPNRLSGSYTKTWQNVTETVTWNLQKCGAELRIIDLKFEDMNYPVWDDWKEIAEQSGTVDGNWVKMKARVLNTSGESKSAEISFKETYKGDKWDGAKPDMPLKDNTVHVQLGPGEEREVEALWDTSGYAWFDDGRPRLVQRVKVEAWEKNKLVDEMTKNLKIAPKPVVLVHGLWSSWRAWESWQNILTTSHSYDWKAFPVGERADKGVMNTGGEFLSSSPTNSIAQNAKELEKYIRYAQEDRNAWHVDVVAHSMGGLISRQYINSLMPANYPDGRPQVSHLVMLGTPNEGSPCADVMNFAFEMTGKKVEAIRELQTTVVAEFNRSATNRKGVKFSVLAGNPLPTICKDVVWNDGVVPVPSAHWQIKDAGLSSSLHTDLTGTKDFSDFVKPRLAIGPRGDHNPAAPEPPGQHKGRLYENRRNYGDPVVFVNAAYGAQVLGGASDARPEFAREARLAPGQTLEIEIPVRAGANFGLTFMSAPTVSATLVNDQGVEVGKNQGGAPASRSFFRTIFYDKPVAAAGTWKLRLENTGTAEVSAIVAAWSDVKTGNPPPSRVSLAAASRP